VIAPIEVVTNLYIGELGRPYHREYDTVLTLSPRPPKSDDRLRHQWVELRHEGVDWYGANGLLHACVGWVRAYWLENYKILIQAPGYAWAELVAATALVHLGASVDEAIVSLRRARPQALADPSFLSLLRAQ
jgi:hypothetical protein